MSFWKVSCPSRRCGGNRSRRQQWGTSSRHSKHSLCHGRVCSSGKKLKWIQTWNRFYLQRKENFMGSLLDSAQTWSNKEKDSRKTSEDITMDTHEPCEGKHCMRRAGNRKHNIKCKWAEEIRNHVLCFPFGEPVCNSRKTQSFGFYRRAFECQLYCCWTECVD